MTSATVALVAATVFAWGALSARLQHADLTAPIVFVGVGLVVHLTAPLDVTVQAETVRLLTEVTLTWVLFSDAARVGVGELRKDAAIFLRLLGLALPLTVLLGWLAASSLFSEWGLWLAVLVGAALAPTDAALGAAVISNPAVPARVRDILNVESGLNDGIVTPVVLVALAGAAASEGKAGGGVAQAAVALVAGAAVGIAIGFIGGWSLARTRRRGWAAEQFTGPAVLALALLAYAAAVSSHGNGFVAAFAAGIAFGNTAGGAGRDEVFYVEETAGLASLLVWLLFGAVAVPIAAHRITWQVVLYAVLSLTVVRMLPVGAALLGTRLGRRTTLFIGWFGPRGMASVVFGLMAVEELGPAADTAVAVIATTVVLSVLAHGLTAGPLADRYAARQSAARRAPPRRERQRSPV